MNSTWDVYRKKIFEKLWIEFSICRIEDFYYRRYVWFQSFCFILVNTHMYLIFPLFTLKWKQQRFMYELLKLENYSFIIKTCLKKIDCRLFITLYLVLYFKIFYLDCFYFWRYELLTAIEVHQLFLQHIFDEIALFNWMLTYTPC